jgi:hypothetical protein
MNRLSILTTETAGKQHVAVYLSDGITVTERSGATVWKTLARTYVAHMIARRQFKRKMRAASKELNNGASIGLEKDGTISSIGNVNFRIERFKCRVENAERTTHQ